MTTKAVHLQTQDQARRIAVRAALLAEDRPVDLWDAVRRLTMLPLDQTRAVAPAANLILWSRLGQEHRPGDLDDAITSQQVVEVAGAWRSIDDVARAVTGLVFPALSWSQPWWVAVTNRR